jgi:hypothetical protein
LRPRVAPAFDLKNYIHIAKPVNPVELLPLISNIMGMWRQDATPN